MNKTLIIGASGTVGTELVKILKSKNVPVLRATSHKKLSEDQVFLNLVTQEGLEKALQNVDQAFLLSPPGYTNQDELLGPVIEKAKTLKLKKIVLMTAMGANLNPEAPMRKAELLLEKSGLTYNIIRPNWFMQNFNTFWLHGILAQQKIMLPVGQAKGSFIDARDIAAVAAELLTTNSNSNQDFDLTGKDVINHDQVAEILSQVTHQKIQYQEITSEAMLDGLLSGGVPKDYAQFLIMILGYFKEGYSERTTTHVENILKRSPITFKKYAEDYKASWIKK